MKQSFQSFATLWAILFLTTVSHAQDTQLLTLIVNVPAHTPTASSFYFTGGPETGCNWQLQCLRFQTVDAPGLSFGVQLKLPRALKKIEFKVTRGSWLNEAARPDGSPLDNQVVELNGTQTIQVLSVTNWKDLGPMGIMGDVVHLNNVYSPQLGNSRDVSVWLPPSYSIASQKHYPVIYMHDGQNLFDPKTSSYGVDWDISQTMTRLALQTGQEAIVVGINSLSAVRFDEYDYTIKGADYARFLIETLKPAIDQGFRTKPGRDSTFVAGSSMGALISVALVWEHAEVFSKALAFSLPAFIHDGSISNLIKASSLPTLPFQMYIDHGDWGHDSGYKQSVVDFINLCYQKGVRPDQVAYAEFPYHDHTEADWARRFQRPAEWLLNGSSYELARRR